MPTKRTVVVTALVALLVAASGCSALQGGDSDRGREIAQQAQESMQDVETYEFEMDMTMSSSQSDQTINMTASGVIDQANHRMRMQMDMLGMSVTQYMIEDTIYMNQGGTWVKQNVTQGNVWEQQQLAQQAQILENATVTFEGTTTIDGEEVAELSVDVSEEQLMEAIAQQGQNLEEQISLDDISYTMYVTQDDHRLKRITADMSMSMGGQSMDASLEMTFSNYNGDVSIELPPEAQNAQSMQNAQAASA